LNSQNVNAVFVGHDHNNDFRGQIELDGIPQLPNLMYGRKTGFGSYGPDHGIKRGARVIELYQNQTLPKTWIRTADGVETVQVEHLPRPNRYLKCGEDDQLDSILLISLVIPTMLVVAFAARFILRRWRSRYHAIRAPNQSRYSHTGAPGGDPVVILTRDEDTAAIGNPKTKAAIE
jgi:hypothetical protein